VKSDLNLRSKWGIQINMWGAAYYSSYNFLKFESFFLSFKGMYFLCTTNLITSHKNQPLLFALSGLEEKK